jgi:hypothetical protein
MSRRADPERIHEARRAATIERLVGEGELRDRAEALVAAWEAQADQDALERDGRYWEAARRWLAAQRARSPHEPMIDAPVVRARARSCR